MRREKVTKISVVYFFSYDSIYSRQTLYHDIRNTDKCDRVKGFQCNFKTRLPNIQYKYLALFE